LLHLAVWSSRYYGNIRSPLQSGNPSVGLEYFLERDALAALNRYAGLTARVDPTAPGGWSFIGPAACPHPACRRAGVLSRMPLQALAHLVRAPTADEHSIIEGSVLNRLALAQKATSALALSAILLAGLTACGGGSSSDTLA